MNRAFCRTMEQRRHGRWRSHGSTVAQPLRLLTATATVTLSLRACLFLCYTPITSPSAADSCYFIKLLGTDQPCVICQDKTHLVEFPLRVGIGARCVCGQKEAGASPDRWGHGAPTRQRGPPWSRGQCLCFCHPPIRRPAACGRSRRTSSSSGSSARRGGLEEARLVNLARQSSVFPVLWQAIPVTIRLQRGCWATSRRR